MPVPAHATNCSQAPFVSVAVLSAETRLRTYLNDYCSAVMKGYASQDMHIAVLGDRQTLFQEQVALGYVHIYKFQLLLSFLNRAWPLLEEPQKTLGIFMDMSDQVSMWEDPCCERV